MLRNVMTTILFLALSQVSKAAEVYLAPVRSTNAPAEMKDAFFETLRLSLEESGTVVLTEGSNQAVALEPSITKLGTAYVLTLREKKQDGKSSMQTIKISDSNDLDTAARRLVRAVRNGVKVTQDQSIGEITKDEVSEDIIRKKTLQRVRIGFGTATAFGLGSSDGLYHLSTAYFWEGAQYAPNVIADLNWAPGSSQMRGVYAGIGLAYHLTKKDTAPYVGFDLGSSYVHRAKTAVTASDGSPLSRSGMTGTVKAGLTILRAMETSLFTELAIRPVPHGFNGKPAAIGSFAFGILF